MNARGITVGNGVVQIDATDAGPTRGILGVTPKTPSRLTQPAELGGCRCTPRSASSRRIRRTVRHAEQSERGTNLMSALSAVDLTGSAA